MPSIPAHRRISAPRSASRFFAGAQELHALQMAAADEGDGVTEGDMEMYGQMAEEIERFHERTMQAMAARGSEN